MRDYVGEFGELNDVTERIIGCAFTVSNSLGNGFLEYVADLLINDAVLVELKAIKSLEDIHFSQCLNYLAATNMRICLLLNFGTQKIQIKRIVR